MLGSNNSFARWGSQLRPGQAVPCRVLNKVEGGYTVSFGPNLKGLLTTDRLMTAGAELLVQFVGYRNHIAHFNSSYGG